MSESNNEFSTAELWSEGRSIELTITRPTPTTVTLTWTTPPEPKAYKGQVVLIHTSPLEVAQQPVDGVRYSASTNLMVPSDTIGGAQVVAANYWIFQDTLTTTSVTLIGALPDEVYYASVHICTNTLQYYPFGVKSYALDGSRAEHNVDGYTGSIPHSNTPPLNPFIGQVYYNQTANNVSMWNGAAWIPASTTSPKSGSTFPTSPVAGEFFYQTHTHTLFIWNSVEWVQANTDQIGTPSYDKVPIGTTGSLDERVRLVNVLKTQLGWPSVCVELHEENFETAIDIALSEFRRRADNAYQRRHVLFTIRADQPTYYLNDPVIGTDRIVDIYKAHRISAIGMNVLGGDNGIYSQIFYNQFFYGAMIDILSIHLANSLSEEFEKIFAGNLPFEWNEAKRELKFIRKLYKEEKVVLECFMERTEQELLTDRWSKNWIRDWALAKCWEMLGMSRTKYGTLPGAGGGLTLNGDMLLQKSETMYTELLRQVNDFEVGNLVDAGNVAFLLG
jgi:hypothetical protein